jgi:MoxR-like ATPase
MFESFDELTDRIKATGYFIDPVVTRIVFLAAKLQKPLLLEGPAGSGKTQLAVSVAQAAGTHIERLQCYRGVTEDKAIGRFDESLQRLYMEFSKGQDANGKAGNWRELQANLKGRDFFRPGPLMRALECEKPCVLLIDEIDKVDEGFEALLLEILSAWQLSVWYMLSFEGCEDQFTSESFDRVFSEYKLFSYVEQPGLLLAQTQPAHV